MSLLIAIPVKPFGVAKARLDSVLSAAQRSRLGRAIAARTIEQALGTGAPVAVVTGDPGVAAWAATTGAEVVLEQPEMEPGLSGAAAAAAAVAVRRESSWLILPADLPLLTVADLEAAISRHRPGGHVIAPSYNGGTSLLMGSGSFAFSYGPGSFHRHLRAAGGAEVVVRTGLALDLDTPRDLAMARALGQASLEVTA
ncbi:MAG: 2-phospho-L-lactate guanylyltransferase [Acidimicrobiia bacterium]